MPPPRKALLRLPDKKRDSVIQRMRKAKASLKQTDRLARTGTARGGKAAE